MSGGCLGDAVAALVDGELDHGSRERALRHLTSCAACRAEVEAHRRLKARLGQLARDAPAPAPDLVARLLALSVAGTDRIERGAAVPPRPVTLRAPAGPGGVRPAGRARAVRRRTAVGSALAALGVVVLTLGAPPSAPTTPVDPATDRFVTRHVGTTGDAPRVVRATLTGEGRGSDR